MSTLETAARPVETAGASNGTAHAGAGHAPIFVSTGDGRNRAVRMAIALAGLLIVGWLAALAAGIVGFDSLPRLLIPETGAGDHSAASAEPSDIAPASVGDRYTHGVASSGAKGSSASSTGTGSSPSGSGSGQGSAPTTPGSGSTKPGSGSTGTTTPSYGGGASTTPGNSATGTGHVMTHSPPGGGRPDTAPSTGGKSIQPHGNGNAYGNAYGAGLTTG